MKNREQTGNISSEQETYHCRKKKTKETTKKTKTRPSPRQE